MLESMAYLNWQGHNKHSIEPFGASGDATGTTAGADATKKELLRAIDVRLAAVREDLATAYARASGIGFNLDTVRDLQHFADHFGAHRLNEACAKFMLLCQRRPDLINPWKPSVEDQVVRSSWGSDMSIDDPTEDETSAVEKAVLKRWSGASDMSIDLGNDKKDDSNIDSPLCTPSSSFVSGTKSNVFPVSSDDDKDQKGFNDTASAANLLKSETRSVSGLKDQGELQTHGGALVGKDEEVNLKDQAVSLAQLRPSAGRGEETGVGDQVVREDKLTVTSDVEEKTGGVKAQLIFQEKSRGVPNRVETVAEKNQAGLQTQIGSFAGRVGNVKFGNRIDDVEVRDPPLSQSRSRISQTHTLSLSGQFKGGFGVEGKELPAKVTDVDLSASQTQWKLFKDEVDRARKGDTEKIKEEDLEVSRMKVHKQPSSGTEQFKKLQGRRDENRDQSGSIHGINKLNFPGNNISKSQESVVTLQVRSADPVQRVRQSKGNQELNDELKMKANELEKLFAEHKLRVPGDQSSSLQRSKPTEVQAEQAESSQYQTPVVVEISPVEFQEKKTVLEPAGSSSDPGKLSTPPRKMVDHQDHGSSLRQSFSERSVLDNSRGRFYERYMQKRDTKLREESAPRTDKIRCLVLRRHAEKLRSFNFQSSLKREQPEDSIQSEADKDLSEFPKQNYSGEDRSYNEHQFHGHASKISNPSSGRQRVQSENPLAQSVPSFSDFRKENAKPFSGVSKAANRSQVRTYAFSKSSKEEIPLVKEEKNRWSQSLRKSSAGPIEFNDLPPLNSDGLVLAPLKFDKEQPEQMPYEKFSKNVETKPFLRKGNGIGPGSGATAAKLKGMVASESLKNEEFEEESPFEAEESVYEAKEEEDEELETTEVEDCANMDNGKPRLSQDSDKIDMSGSENGDSLRSISQI
ncbi:COP1-INTERACTING PROTEIN-RELATED [Salix viminalis]|uniref:COP1-INTERACTING PROTEIN-RELATED n=1 Tax=Salix viminalis TaxID=40686 RepID=A0A9Q0QD46_SALVM|nr:COP1-INTERACTING PROTEIN-RELATED [Salix viminalis]